MVICYQLEHRGYTSQKKIVLAQEIQVGERVESEHETSTYIACVSQRNQTNTQTTVGVGLESSIACKTSSHCKLDVPLKMILRFGNHFCYVPQLHQK